MRKFKLTMGDDIRTFESESPSDVLDHMREGNFCAPSNDSEFLRVAASLTNAWSGDTIRFNSKEDFAEDLMSAGFLKEITDESR
tara:strand:- start:2061 stop:2312 length:252 start_codon:yes stop_codon:yes gene_type:complete